MTQLGYPENYSMIQSLTSNPPPYHPLTQVESQLLANLNMNLFKPQFQVNIEKFKYFTLRHPNQPLISYLIDGLKYGFRLGFTGTRTKSIMNNLSSLSLSPTTFYL